MKDEQKTIQLISASIAPENFCATSNYGENKFWELVPDALSGKKAYIYLYSVPCSEEMNYYRHSLCLNFPDHPERKTGEKTKYELAQRVVLKPLDITNLIFRCMLDNTESNPKESAVLLSFSSIASAVVRLKRTVNRYLVDNLSEMFGDRFDIVYEMDNLEVGALMGNALFLPIDWYKLLSGADSKVAYNVIEKFYTKITKRKVQPTNAQKSNSVTIGADPEFFMYDTKNLKKGKVIDYKGSSLQVSKLLQGSPGGMIGTDGMLGELRPKYGKTPEELVRNLESVMIGLERIISTQKPDAVIETGGGFRHSIGGHIHFGHPSLKQLVNSKELDKLGTMLDDFLYYPIRNNMPASMRQWSEHHIISKKITFPNHSDVSIVYGDSNQKIMDKAKEAVSPNLNIRFNHYEASKAFRGQPHGIEYRSLPSFICDKDFSYLVLKIAKGIAERFLSSNTNPFTYNSNPIKEDYLNFITEEEYDLFMQYICGEKNDVFTKDARELWGVKGKYDTWLHFTNFASYPNRNSLQVMEFYNKLIDDFNPVAKLLCECDTPMAQGFKKPIRIHLKNEEYFMSQNTTDVYRVGRVVYSPYPFTSAMIAEANRRNEGHDAVIYYCASSQRLTMKRIKSTVAKCIYLLSKKYADKKTHETIKKILNEVAPGTSTLWKNLLTEYPRIEPTIEEPVNNTTQAYATQADGTTVFYVRDLEVE